jgi:hypothetical protein
MLVLRPPPRPPPPCDPGAGDDASNVGVMLEMATNLLSSPLEDIPEHPVLFMFSGAEEPLCQVGAGERGGGGGKDGHTHM